MITHFLIAFKYPIKHTTFDLLAVIMNMWHRGLFIMVLFCVSGLFAQEIKTPYATKKITTIRDTIQMDSVSINQSFFKIINPQGEPLDTAFYKVDFQKARLVFKNNYKSADTLTLRYLKFPDFLTKEYAIYDKSRIVDDKNGLGNLYKIESGNLKKNSPFEGLNTSGSISRGVTVGNNQNASVNSNLDLQITGKLSDKVSIRASLQDTNIPLQEGGYSQKLDEFDQIFIELFGEKWNIRAGDLFLENRKSRFLNFNKKVQGLSTQFTLGTPENKTDIYAAAALVRGQYAKSTFVGQEGNQGPYKLRGQNGELFILVISGSERVYVNGILLTRGENNQYVIDYNAGEITFTSLFPITSEMRINIEYQYSDRNYTRFVTYAGVNHEQEKWSLGGYVYAENDSKNQPLQQSLSEEQVAVLASAGDNLDLMSAPSAAVDSYSENKILYKKIIIGAAEIFEYSNNPQEVLYTVKFSFRGNNQGDYVLSNSIVNGRIYQYVAPIAGIKQGSYDPLIRLVAPTKIQIATLLGKYNPSEKTNVDFELGLSNNDKNLFSNIDDKDNQGIAGKLNFKQRLLSKKWNIDAYGSYQLIQNNYKTIERLFTIEFNRDWNLANPLGNQSLFTGGIEFSLPDQSKIRYQYENLNFSQSFSGNRHVIAGFLNHKNWRFATDGSYLASNSSESSSKFLRNNSQTKYHFNKNWIGGSFRHENNQERLKIDNQLSALSQRFSEVGAFVGRGDSTKVFVEIGYLNRLNDSLQSGFLKRVNNSHSYYIKSKLIQTEKSDLSLFVNYRKLKFEDPLRSNESSLNSRILYNDRFFNQLIQSTTAFETSSGTIAQQEFNFLAVEAGKGVYTWNDYNGNGIQEIQEFEIAPFPDQAKYIKIFLPNQIFLKTHQNKFSQSLILNPSQWQNEGGFQKALSHFYNQSSYLIERKIKREQDNFDLNPFNAASKDLLGLNSSIRNSLFYNRGKQKHAVTYTFVTNSLRSVQSSGQQESKSESHQLQYAHLLKKTWLMNVSGKSFGSEINSENYASRNFIIKGYQVEPKISYLFSKNVSLDIFYELQRKNNKIGEKEVLLQNRLGTSFNYAGEKRFTLNGEFSYYDNQFQGNPFSPVAFQMLEGLQAGKNLTWRLLAQKNLTQFLDININYQGRKTELSQTIHTGNIQLRAYF
jgi:hypothetical protein